ncbi:hypothetical protein BD410DRAFT_691109, partial [Rickenella mellea]
DACNKCQAIGSSRLYLDLKRRAGDNVPHTNTPHQYLNNLQLRHRLQTKTDDVNAAKLNILSVGRRLGTATQVLDDHKRLVMTIAKADVKGIHRLIATSVRQNISVRQIIERLKNAMEHVYRPRGYTEAEFAMARLCHNI